MEVCTRVCRYSSMYVGTRVGLYVCVSVCTYVCLCVCTCARTRTRVRRVPRHQVSGGQAVHARPSRSICEGRSSCEEEVVQRGSAGVCGGGRRAAGSCGRGGGGGVRNIRGGEESSSEQDNEGDRDRSQAQAGIHDMMATLVQELRNEERLMADFANAYYEGRRVNGFYQWVLLGTFGFFWFVAYSNVRKNTSQVVENTHVTCTRVPLIHAYMFACLCVPYIWYVSTRVA